MFQQSIWFVHVHQSTDIILVSRYQHIRHISPSSSIVYWYFPWRLWSRFHQTWVGDACGLYPRLWWCILNSHRYYPELFLCLFKGGRIFIKKKRLLYALKQFFSGVDTIGSIFIKELLTVNKCVFHVFFE